MLVSSVNLAGSNKFFLAAALWTIQYDGDYQEYHNAKAGVFLNTIKWLGAGVRKLG